MPSRVRPLIAAAVAGALIAVSTGTIAAAPATVPQPTVQQATAAASTNPWLALSAMTSGSSSAATAAAAQSDHGPGFPPAAPLAVILGTIALSIWILAHEDDGDFDFDGEPVSP